MRPLAPMLAMLAALTLAAPGIARADEKTPPLDRERAEELAREGLEKMMRALGAVIDSIPLYELPEILDNGDIIIRRHPPKPKAGDDDEPKKIGGTKT